MSMELQQHEAQLLSHQQNQQLKSKNIASNSNLITSIPVHDVEAVGHQSANNKINQRNNRVSASHGMTGHM